jgi:dienelactone hydrolase
MQPTTTPRGSGVRLLASVLLVLSVLLAPGLARAQEPIPLVPMEDPTFGVTTVVPEGWVNLGQGIHARRPGAADFVLLAVQSVQVPMDSVWPSLQQQLRLTEPPAPTGARTTPTFEWTLYQVDVEAPVGTLRVDLATAAEDGTTYLVLFQSPVEGSEVLRDAVFLPAVDALQPLAPEPTPDPATLPYDLEEVTFTGGSPDVTLAGTLSLPRGDGPHPAVVLFSGSGAQDRDESLRPVAAIKPFALLADALTRAGIAVLRYDDRGTAQSTGDYTTARLADLTADAQAAFDFLRARPEIDPARTGVLGHSEGGIYTASLIEAGAPIAFAVALAGPATNGVDLMVAQNGAIVRSTGATDAEVTEAETYARLLYAAVLAGDEAEARSVAEAYFGAYWDRQTDELRAALGDRDAFVKAQADGQVAATTIPWFVDLLRSDASVGWGVAEMPVLGLFGGKDIQVLADQNAPIMEASLGGRNPASRVVTLPDANHLFQAAVTGSLAEYGTLEQTFTPELLPLLVGWVAEQAGLPAPAISPPASPAPASPAPAASPAG